MEKIAKFIRDVGFPCFVSVALLYILFVTLENNTRAMRALEASVKLTHPQYFSAPALPGDTRETHLPK